MKFCKNDEAVSPVIGVILMVAITVILAAVIAAFIFGMAGNIQKTKVLAATAQQPDAMHIIVTYQGGMDAISCDNVTITVTPENGTPQVHTISPPSGKKTVTVGDSYTFSAAPGKTFAGKDHVVAKAHFVDTTEQVILDYTI